MEERYEQLLCEVVREYIRTAQPVGSAALLPALGWDVSSATIRNMLKTLEDEEYIYQPHTSAGRIPTDKGYRQYVNALTIRDLRHQQLKRLTAQYEEVKETYDISGRAAAKLLSELVELVAVGGSLHSHNMYDFGLSALMKQPEGSDLETIREASTLVDTIDEWIDDLPTQVDVASAYIGSENPAGNSQYTSILTKTAILPSGEKVLLLIIGPKRMPYDRHIALLNGVASILHNSQ